MPNPEPIHARQAFGKAVLCLSSGYGGSRVGDIFLGITRDQDQPLDETIIPTKNPFVTVEVSNHTDLIDLRPQFCGGQYPSLWVACHDLMRDLSTLFRQKTARYPIKEDRTPGKFPFPQSGTFVILDDDQPQEKQLVMNVQAEQVALYTQMAAGGQGGVGYDPRWQIWRSPSIILPTSGLTKTWTNLVRAIAFETTQERFHPEYSQPFDRVLEQNPNCEWVCAN